MRTTTLSRIEKPRVEKGESYTKWLWEMFRAWKPDGLPKNDLLELDENRDLIVIDPEREMIKKSIEGLLKKTFTGLGDSKTDEQLLTILEPEELSQLRALMKSNEGSWYTFADSVPDEILINLSARLDERFPNMKIQDAKKKLDELIK